MPEDPETNTTNSEPDEHPELPSIDAGIQQAQPQSEATADHTTNRPPVWQTVYRWFASDWVKSLLSQMDAKDKWNTFLAIIGIAIAALTARTLVSQLGQMRTQSEVLISNSYADDKSALLTARLAEEQVRAAQGSVNAITKQMREDQRAWLTPTYEPAILKDEQPIGQLFYYTNKGKSPAKKIHAKFRMIIVHDNDRPSFRYPKREVTRSDVNVLFPELREGLGILLYVPSGYPQKVPYSGQIKQQFVNGNLMFMTYGAIEYDDIFHMHHWVHYCTMTFATVHLTTPLVAEKCRQYADTDDR